MTKDQFIQGYCDRSGITLDEFNALYDVYSCTDDPFWQVVEKGKEPLLPIIEDVS